MKGLIIKDFLNLKQMLLIIILGMTFLGIISFANKDVAFFSVMLCVFSAVIPINTFAYDEKSKWNSYALVLPVTPKQIVLQKYLIGIICSVASAALVFMLNAFVVKDVFASLTNIFQYLGVSFFIMAVMLPFVFKLGVEKARLVMLILVALVVGLSILLNDTSINESVIQLFSNTGTMQAVSNFLPQVLIISSIVLLVISMLISVKIYEKKEI